MWDLIEREVIYLYYYLDIQVRQLFWFYVLGTLLGSAISVGCTYFSLDFRFPA